MQKTFFHSSGTGSEYLSCLANISALLMKSGTVFTQLTPNGKPGSDPSIRPPHAPASERQSKGTDMLDIVTVPPNVDDVSAWPMP